EAERNVHTLRENSRKTQIEELNQQLNRLNHELVSVKTKQEQYQTFITNSQNRKQDIEEKIVHLSDELLTAEPRLEALRSAEKTQAVDLQAFQDTFQDISELLTE